MKILLERCIKIIFTINLIMLTCGKDGTSEIKIKEQEGTLIGGSMAFDGAYIWTMSIKKGFTSESGKTIIKIDKKGEIVDSFIPQENIASDIAFDGNTLWTGYVFGWKSGRTYSDHGAIYSINPETGELIHEFTIPDYFDEIEGMAAAPGILWVMIMARAQDGQRVEHLYEIDLKKCTIENTHSFTEFDNCSGIAYMDGNIWALTGLFHKKVMRINLSNGMIDKEYDFQGKIINGILCMKDKIYLFDEEKDVLTPIK